MVGRDELLKTLHVANVMARENPCGMSDAALMLLAKGIGAMLSQQYTKSMNQEAAAKYLGVSTRTLQRWSAEYEDFPKGRHDGNKALSYDPLEIIEWKTRHEAKTI